MKTFAKCFIMLLIASAVALACAQDVQRTPASQVSAVPKIAPAQSVPNKVNTEGRTVIVALDITGSFVDHMLSKGLFDRAMKHVKKLVPEHVEIGSEVRTAIVGHSHRDVTNGDQGGSYDHIAARNWTVTRNHHTKDRVVIAVINQLEEWRTDLEKGKIKPQNNTALAMALDHMSEQVRLAGKPCLLVIISDMEETEYRAGVPQPYKSGQLTGCKVYAIGAGITLAGGNQAQRKLRSKWEKYFVAAGVAANDFYWIANP